MKFKMTGIILAGGKNSRMGTNKAFLELDGTSIIERINSVLSELFPEIIIVTNDPLSYTQLSPAVIVTDIYKNKGALGGIYAGLFFASENHAFITACDMPFINKDLIAYLAGLTANYDIVVPQGADGMQPLHAVYSKNCLAPIKKNLEADKLKITGFYKGLRVLTVTEEKLQPFNEDGKTFLNINTPGELDKLRLR
ncbi:MAG TPA: molybdenum cofactor guanylyltransferase [Smithellaceae bacterium]|nr:molybdenum cofactor guanylyltransferase [Smithellaceae bacterium]HRS88729.1 molybdenum cofactor guanylyltransferase [Smithellaceae bacterium]HRV26540.1 molybdenum cofactor guanylyltransferase [Smithellaceae bacterium]